MLKIIVNVYFVYIVLATFASCQKISYEGSTLYEISVESESQEKKLNIFNKNPDIVCIFEGPLESVIQHVYFIVRPPAREKFNKFLARNKFSYNVVIQDFASVLDEEHGLLKPDAVSPGQINFDSYHRIAVINDYLKNVAVKYSNVTNLLNIGETTEGRDILALKVSTGDGIKPIILIQAGIHAREWIAPAVALYIIQQIVETAENRRLIQNVDWLIIPSLNPDGYEYSHTTDRLWRKNLSRGKKCNGTDLNRNFGFHWGEHKNNENECADTYHGLAAFSEPESRAFRDLVIKHAARIKLAVNVHSSSQLILYPWGYKKEVPPNAALLQSLGNNVAKAIEEVAGTHYDVGGSAEILYSTSGDSNDWILGTTGVNLSYTIELPPWRNFPYSRFLNGFSLPANHIRRVVTETFEGIKVFHQYVETMVT